MPLTDILWDWNGTLLDDTDAAVGALNVLLRRRNLATVSLEWYRDNFSFPVRPVYARCGIDLEHEDWDALAREYHDAYAAFPKKLNDEATSALEAVRAHGLRQSVISALRQDLLDAAIENFGLTGYFAFIVGVDNLDGGSKLDRARELYAKLQSLPNFGRSVLIGDSIHDHEVADALGIGCVLCSQGGHSYERLAAVAPTVRTLNAASDYLFSGKVMKKEGDSNER